MERFRDAKEFQTSKDSQFVVVNSHECLQLKDVDVKWELEEVNSRGVPRW